MVVPRRGKSAKIFKKKLKIMFVINIGCLTSAKET